MTTCVDECPVRSLSSSGAHFFQVKDVAKSVKKSLSNLPSLCIPVNS